MTTRSIDPSVFRLMPTLCLIGGRHRVSGRLAFPLPKDPDAYEPVEFPTAGTVWSYTVQRIAPKSPPYRGATPFVPFAVAYVELPGAMIIEARLTQIEFSALRIGLPVELAAIPLYQDEEGFEVLAFAFAPHAARSS